MNQRHLKTSTAATQH